MDLPSYRGCSADGSTADRAAIPPCGVLCTVQDKRRDACTAPCCLEPARRQVVSSAPYIPYARRGTNYGLLLMAWATMRQLAVV